MKALTILLLALAAWLDSAPLFGAGMVLAAVQVSTWLWMRYAMPRLQIDRSCERRLFFGETATVRVHIANTGALPIPWLLVREHRPTAICLPSVISQVYGLQARQHCTLSYTLTGSRRGFHTVGPLLLSAGEVLGLAQRELYHPARQHLIVYPRIFPAHQLELPALALFGDLRSRRHMLGDPARVAGVRDYAPGDPLHDIHWRATAATGALQVKQYQPATTIQTMIFLDLQRDGYRTADLLQAGDFAVSVAATVASRMIDQRQEVGLATNGLLALPPADDATPEDDPLLRELQADALEATPPVAGTEPGAMLVAAPPLVPAGGRAQLIRLLELLARVELAEGAASLLPLLTRHSLALPWGSTAVVITGATSEMLFLALHRLREAGLLVVLLVVDRQAQQGELEGRARALGLRLQVIRRDVDLEGLRG